MATTRIMPLHAGKGRTVGKAISDIIDYVKKPATNVTAAWPTPSSCWTSRPTPPAPAGCAVRTM